MEGSWKAEGGRVGVETEVEQEPEGCMLMLWGLLAGQPRVKCIKMECFISSPLKSQKRLLDTYYQQQQIFRTNS